jgi:oligoendopeptidase F
MIKTALPARSEIPLEQTWNLNNIFETVKAWAQAKNEILTAIPSLKKYEGKLSDGAEALADFFELYQSVLIEAAKVYAYGRLSMATDTSNQTAQAQAGQGQSVFIELMASVSFLNPELMQIGFEELRKWTKKEPRLAYLGHFIDELEREKDHVRSDEVENVLALSDEPMSNFFRAYTALTNADLQFKDATAEDGSKYEVGQSNINAFITAKDRQLRKTGYENYADGYISQRNTLTGLQLGDIHKDVFNARVRNYPSSLAASLGANNIPEEVFYTLIDTFKKNLPTWHRYWQIRRKILSFDHLYVYDIKAPLSAHPPIIPFEQAIEWIGEALAPLGKDYINILKTGALKDRWVDRARNRGKRQGAFSSGVYGTNPFIMMSYADDVFSMSTLAHELGHSMHSYATNKTQPYIYSHYSLFVAEVASNFHQAMLRDYLFKTQKDPDFQLALIEEAMSNFHRYFFIMPTLARWELEVHERAEAGKPLNAEIMSDICAELFAEGYGKEVEYDNAQIGITWAQFQHMYMNFYVYQYATGISAAHALANKVLKEGQVAVNRYLDFLRAGSSVYPLNALNSAGVDMTSSTPVKKTFEVMAGYIDRLEKIIVAE